MRLRVTRRKAWPVLQSLGLQPLVLLLQVLSRLERHPEARLELRQARREPCQKVQRREQANRKRLALQVQFARS